MRQFKILVFAVALSGCATGPAYVDAPPPSDSEAVVYIYRMPNLAAAARNAAFYIDDVKVVDLMAGGYSYAYVTPGRHLIQQKWPYWPLDMGTIREAVGIPLYVKAGEIRYVRFQSGVGAAPCYNCISIEWSIHEVDAAVGRSEIKGEKFAEPFVKTGGQ